MRIQGIQQNRQDELEHLDVLYELFPIDTLNIDYNFLVCESVSLL